MHVFRGGYDSVNVNILRVHKNERGPSLQVLDHGICIFLVSSFSAVFNAFSLSISKYIEKDIDMGRNE